MILTQQDLEARLWGAANALRAPVDPADFKTYVFPMLFCKWICDIGTDGLMAANEKMTEFLGGAQTVHYQGTPPDEYHPLRLVDNDALGNNTFHVTDGPAGAGRRYHLVLWVNGVPLVVIETKTPVKAKVSWLNAARDLTNIYQVEGRALFVPNVLIVATEGRDFHYGGVGQGAEDWQQWGSTDTPEDLDGFERVKVSVDGLLTPARILSMLKEFTLFERLEDGAMIKLLSRYPQALAPKDLIKGGRRDIDVAELAGEFDQRTKAILVPRFASGDRTDTGFVALQAAITTVGDKDGSDKFAREFTGVEALWEFLAPAPVLDAHKADDTWLAKVYKAIKPTGVSNDLLWARLGAKTLNLAHGHISNVAVTGTGLEEVVVDPEAIKALKEKVEKGQIDLPDGDKDRDLVDDPVTLDDVLDTIESRIKRRLESSGGHAVYRSLAEQIEKLRSQAMQRAEDSIEFLKKALQVAKTAVEAERLEDAAELDEDTEALLDPNLGALTQIVDEYKPEGTPFIGADVARDIDAIVKQVRFTGWNSTQDGDRIVPKELREKVLLKYGLPPTGPLFDNAYAYAYVAENY